jgi:hypothetical protein
MPVLKEASARLSSFVMLIVQMQAAGVKAKELQYSARLCLGFRSVIKCGARMLLINS